MLAIQVIKNTNGSYMLEACVTLVLLIDLLSGFLTLSYLSFCKVWLNHQVYEAAICLGSQSSVIQCEQSLRKSINSVLPIGKLSSLNSIQNSRFVKSEVYFQIGSKYHLHGQHQIKLPLKVAHHE